MIFGRQTIQICQSITADWNLWEALLNGKLFKKNNIYCRQIINHPEKYTIFLALTFLFTILTAVLKDFLPVVDRDIDKRGISRQGSLSNWVLGE